MHNSQLAIINALPATDARNTRRVRLSPTLAACYAGDHAGMGCQIAINLYKFCAVDRAALSALSPQTIAAGLSRLKISMRYSKRAVPVCAGIRGEVWAAIQRQPGRVMGAPCRAVVSLTAGCRLKSRKQKCVQGTDSTSILTQCITVETV